MNILQIQLVAEIESTGMDFYLSHSYSIYSMGQIIQDAQLSQRDRAAG